MPIESTQRRRTRWNRSGQGLIEYILIIALASIALILVLLVFRNQIGNGVDSANQSLDSASATYYIPGGGAGGNPGGGSQGRGRGGGQSGGRGSGQGNGN